MLFCTRKSDLLAGYLGAGAPLHMALSCLVNKYC
jgi:hypothetical protein